MNFTYAVGDRANPYQSSIDGDWVSLTAVEMKVICLSETLVSTRTFKSTQRYYTEDQHGRSVLFQKQQVNAVNGNNSSLF